MVFDISGTEPSSALVAVISKLVIKPLKHGGTYIYNLL
jgi:hypothetical protein